MDVLAPPVRRELVREHYRGARSSSNPAALHLSFRGYRT
ncbi:hypothetical protein C725_2680 [Pacificimonas flava]|uniref:Uncharacterized protein n=1 Tax=Pacificimonas flava TaxID=1234595 RepID=M2TJS1_9SPHN|nr:hypothetical protein C725_2680 [Pacificimonas flava]